jgi:hypothetical protein
VEQYKIKRAQSKLHKWIEYYNRNYLHSAHRYRTPIQAKEDYYRNHASYNNAA